MAEIRSGRHDYGLGPVLPCVAGNHQPVVPLGHRRCFGHDELYPGVEGLFLDRWSQFRSGNSLGEARVVFNVFDVDNLGAAHQAFDDGGAHAVPGGVYAGGHAGQPAPHNQNVVFFGQAITPRVQVYLFGLRSTIVAC